MKNLALLLLLLFAVGCCCGCSVSASQSKIGDEAVTQMAVTDKMYRDVAKIPASTVINPDTGLTVGHLLAYLDNTWVFEQAVAVDADVIEKTDSRPSLRPYITPAPPTTSKPTITPGN